MLQTKFQDHQVNWFWRRRSFKVFTIIYGFDSHDCHVTRPFEQLIVPPTSGATHLNLVRISPLVSGEKLDESVPVVGNGDCLS